MADVPGRFIIEAVRYGIGDPIHRLHRLGGDVGEVVVPTDSPGRPGRPMIDRHEDLGTRNGEIAARDGVDSTIYGGRGHGIDGAAWAQGGAERIPRIAAIA